MSQDALKNPQSLARRLQGQLIAWPVVILMFLCLLFFNGLQTLSLLLLPFSRRAFRGFNRFAANTWWGWTVTLAQVLYGTRIEVSGDELPIQENAILVANHQQMPDITYLFFLAKAKKRLGDLKWFVKDIIKWIPGVGWGMLFLDALFVKRNWTRDQASVEATFRSITRGRVPLWLMMFVEGTRMRPSKRAASQAFAKSKNLPIWQHVLIPRSKGFEAAVVGLGEHIDAVYDVTIGYPDGVPTLWQYTRGFSRVACLHIKRYARAALPGKDQLGAWLTERFAEKERLLEHFFKTGSFPQSAS